MPGRCITDATVRPMTTTEATCEAICWDAGGRILAVGDTATVTAVAQEHGIPIESLPGTTLIPGFVDAHMHFFHVGVRRMRPDLRHATSLQDALDQVTRWVTHHPGDGPILAEGWDESTWPEARFPTKDEVDSISKDRPVVLRRQDGHFAVANSVALPELRSHWDDDGLVDLETGVIKEQPSLYLNEVYGVPPDELDDALQVATDVAHRLGVTCVGEYTQAPFRDALMRAAERGTLRIRIANHIYVQQLHDAIAEGFRTGTPRGLQYDGDGSTSPTPAMAPTPADASSSPTPPTPGTAPTPSPNTDATSPAAKGGDATPSSVERLRDGGLKVFLDGSFGGRTAWLRDPYRDDPDDEDNRGTPIWSDDECLDWFRTAHDAGIQITAHAIGDAAIDQGLDAYEKTLDGVGAVASDAPGDDAVHPGPGIGLRHRFEHYELPQDDAVQRTVDLGITACAQPNFLGEWSAKGGMYERRLGEVFLLNNRYRTFLDVGMSLCFGSDGMPFGPLYGIQAAVDHPFEDQRITAAEAVWLYTARAAWACHWDDRIGTLEAGKRADVLVLDTPDLDAKPPEEWVIRETILDGQSMAQGDHVILHADALDGPQGLPTAPSAHRDSSAD